MGLFDKFKKTVYDGFSTWLDEQLSNQELDKVVGFCFNLYEDTDNRWSVELVGTSEFLEQDTDWACEELFATRENPYVIRYDGTFGQILEIFKKYAAEYLDKGTYKDKLKEKAGVGIGFVDGDLEILYKNPNWRSSKRKKKTVPDKENYYKIFTAEDTGDSWPFLKFDQQELPFGRYEVYESKPLSADKIYCTVARGDVSSRDYLDNLLGFLIISGKVKSIMEEHDIESCQFIDVIDKDTGNTVGYLVNCLKHYEALDYDKAVYFTSDRLGVSVVKPALLSDKIEHKDFFQIEEDEFAYFISDKLRSALKKAHAKGFDFQKAPAS